MLTPTRRPCFRRLFVRWPAALPNSHLLAMVALAAILTAGVSGAGTAFTPHDFSGKGWGTDETCKFCHIPHTANDPQLAPLWNHASTSQTGYSLFDSPTLNATPTDPTSVSRACLSCHDGTMAIDSYGGRTGTILLGDAAAGSYSNSTRVVGSDLTDDHPVSIKYRALGEVGLHATPQNNVPLFGDQADQVECASCHNPHDNSHAHFLRVDNSGSALCLSCHNK